MSIILDNLEIDSYIDADGFLEIQMYSERTNYAFLNREQIIELKEHLEKLLKDE